MSSVNGEDDASRSSWQRPDAPLGTLIFREGLLSAEQLEDALGESVKRGKRLGQVLVERGLLEEAQVARDARAPEGPRLRRPPQTPVDPSAATLLASETAWLTHAVPVSVADGTPLVAVEDPGDEESMKTVVEALGTQPRFAVATRTDILRVLGSVFPQSVGPPAAQVPLAQPLIQAAPEPAPAPAAAEAPAEPAPQPVLAEVGGLRVAAPAAGAGARTRGSARRARSGADRARARAGACRAGARRGACRARTRTRTRARTRTRTRTRGTSLGRAGHFTSPGACRGTGRACARSAAEPVAPAVETIPAPAVPAAATPSESAPEPTPVTEAQPEPAPGPEPAAAPEPPVFDPTPPAAPAEAPAPVAEPSPPAIQRGSCHRGGASSPR